MKERAKTGKKGERNEGVSCSGKKKKQKKKGNKTDASFQESLARNESTEASSLRVRE